MVEISQLPWKKYNLSKELQKKTQENGDQHGESLTVGKIQEENSRTSQGL